MGRMLMSDSKYWEEMMARGNCGHGGGGGSGRSRSKKVGGAIEHTEVIDEPQEEYVPPYRVFGLTPGEHRFYSAGYAQALEVVRELLDAIRSGAPLPSMPETKEKRNWKREYTVHGLQLIEFEVLDAICSRQPGEGIRTRSAFVTAHLASYARHQGKGRIVFLDREAAHRAQRRIA